MDLAISEASGRSCWELFDQREMLEAALQLGPSS